jgi:hypothetical protein
VLFESTCSCTSLDLSKIAIFKRYTFSDYFVPKISACAINFGIKIWSANKARVGSSSLVWHFHKLNSLNKNFKLIYQSSSKWNTAVNFGTVYVWVINPLFWSYILYTFKNVDN